MDFNQQVEEIGFWKKEKVLGSGGFGYVVLWRNKETNEMIALKECRWGHDSVMSPKNRSRWKLEVDMMLRLNHPNVVKAFSVPTELDVPVTEMPILAMEYCSGGDLRKLLNKPENCCGLSEKHVRLLLRHVSSAIYYLHSKRIIHRDLKPENIVIQDRNGKVMYKLIDLGYAKELDQGSLCTSFVGTLQYLAPELFLSKKYSCTVDFWSLGLVTHEIITGLRPFLPDKAPPEWIPIIKQKSSTVIRAYLDEDKNVAFSNEIYPLHRICNVLKSDIEMWLQLMLEWDPKKRGKQDETTAYSILEKFLNKKVVFIFYVEKFQLLSFAVDDNSSLKEFQKLLEDKTGVGIDHQEILLPKGHSPTEEKGIAQFVSNLEEDEKIIFLFNKDSSSKLQPSGNIAIPPSVEKILRNPREAVKYAEQRTSWSEAVFLSHQELLLHDRLVLAFKTSLMDLLIKASSTKKTTSRMITEMNKLVAKSSFFQKCLQQDLSSYEQRSQNGNITSKHMLESWKSSLENLKKIEVLKQKVIILEETSNELGARTVELQRSPYARLKQSNPLEETYSKILDIYSELRRRPKDQRHVSHDNTDMVRLLCLCLKHRDMQISDVTSHISSIGQIKREMTQVHPQTVHLLKEICDWDAQVHSWQHTRQQDIWKLVDSFSRRASQPEHSFPSAQLPISLHSSIHQMTLSHTIPRSAPLAINGKPRPRFQPGIQVPVIPLNSTLQSQLLLQGQTSTESPYGDSPYFPRGFHSSGYSVGSEADNLESVLLSSILEKSSEDSRRIQQENQKLAESFQSMIDFMKSNQSFSELNFFDQDETNPHSKNPPD